MNRQQTQDRIAQIIEKNTEGELQITIDNEHRLGTRFNDCAISQNTLKSQSKICITARLDKKKASIELNSVNDEELIKRAIKQVFNTCKHMPDDDETMQALGEVIDTPEYAFNNETDGLTIEDVGQWIASACKEGVSSKIDLAGFLSINKNFTAYGDSTGGFAFERYHRTDFHVTATGGEGSGWAEVEGRRLVESQVFDAAKRAIQKCTMAQSPKIFEPKETTVILEPQAVGNLLSMAFWYGFNQRAKDEGRSVFSDFEETMGSHSLYSDPTNTVFPTVSFSSEGQNLGKSTWLDKGEIQQLVTDRFWARNKKLSDKPSPYNLILTGDGTSVEKMIQDTKDGILVTRFWYVRSTDAKSLGFTGMTRDGTFRIQDGKITHPVVDMRWNDSVIRVLKNIAASGVPTATGEFLAMAMPALKVDGFRFTSLSG